MFASNYSLQGLLEKNYATIIYYWHFDCNLRYQKIFCVTVCIYTLYKYIYIYNCEETLYYFYIINLSCFSFAVEFSYYFLELAK